MFRGVGPALNRAGGRREATGKSRSGDWRSPDRHCSGSRGHGALFLPFWSTDASQRASSAAAAAVFL
jgi:hypothetical protein